MSGRFYLYQNIEMNASVKQKITTHWEHYLTTRGENQLRHGLWSYYDWYKLKMSPDPEIDEYFNQIVQSKEYISSIEQLQLMEDMSKFIGYKKELCYQQMRKLLP